MRSWCRRASNEGLGIIRGGAAGGTRCTDCWARTTRVHIGFGGMPVCDKCLAGQTRSRDGGKICEKKKRKPTRVICQSKHRSPGPSSNGDQAAAEEAENVGVGFPTSWTSQATGIALVARNQGTVVTTSQATSFPSSILNGSPSTGGSSRLGEFGSSWAPWASRRLVGGAARTQVRLARFPSSTYRDGRRSRAGANLALYINTTKELASRACV